MPGSVEIFKRDGGGPSLPRAPRVWHALHYEWVDVSTVCPGPAMDLPWTVDIDEGQSQVPLTMFHKIYH